MSADESHVRRPRSFWISMIEDWDRAGRGSRTKFAEKRGVSPSTFAWWIRRVEADDMPNGRRQRRPSSKPRKVYTSVYLTPEQHKNLTLLSELLDQPLADFIRDGADLVLAQHEKLLPKQESLPLDGTNG